MPVSFTQTSSVTEQPCAARGAGGNCSLLLRTATKTSPWSVNLSALEIRLTRTWRSRAMSP